MVSDKQLLRDIWLEPNAGLRLYVSDQANKIHYHRNRASFHGKQNDIEEAKNIEVEMSGSANKIIEKSDNKLIEELCEYVWDVVRTQASANELRIKN